MKIIIHLIALLALFWPVSTQAQVVNFRTNYRKTNPAPPDSALPFAEKVQMHQTFLKAAMLSNDPEKRLYGFLYLFSDFAQNDDYAEAARYLLEAEGIAQASGNPGWQGWVMGRKGALFIDLKNYREALSCYEAARNLCGQAGDSLCLAESLEQMGAAYSRLGDFEQAHLHYGFALPLMEKYGNEIQMATTLNNFANLHLHQDRYEESLPYYERSLTLIRKIGNKKQETIYLNNLASSYNGLRRFDIAKKILHQCLADNLENGWLHSAIDNYAGLAVAYEETGDFRAALDFSGRSYALRDSLIGVETQDEIADWEAKYQNQQKELELQKSQVALGIARQRLERGALFVFFALLLIAFGLWRWRIQTRQAHRERQQNQQTLADMTRLLLDKNAQLTTLQEQTTGQSPPDDTSPGPANFETNLYEQRILTEADWAAFKVYFEKAYPGYLQRLRAACPALSDAEERLFLFIKLNLTRKEAAAILGISADSVKKTRNRLRKRLELAEEADLDLHIRAF